MPLWYFHRDIFSSFPYFTYLSKISHQVVITSSWWEVCNLKNWQLAYWIGYWVKVFWIVFELFWRLVMFVSRICPVFFRLLRVLSVFCNLKNWQLDYWIGYSVKVFWMVFELFWRLEGLFLGFVQDLLGFLRFWVFWGFSRSFQGF